MSTDKKKKTDTHTMKRVRQQSWELDDLRCSCGFPETNSGCEALLAENNPTEAPLPTEGTDVAVGGTDGAGDGGDEGTPTWVIVTAIAMVRCVWRGVAWRASFFRRVLLLVPWCVYFCACVCVCVFFLI